MTGSNDSSGRDDLEARFDRALGTTEEIFAPSPTIVGGRDITLDLGSLLSNPNERIDTKAVQQIGYDHLKSVVDEFARTKDPASLRKLLRVVFDEVQTDVNFQYWKINSPELYERALAIPNMFLEYGLGVLSEITETSS